MFSTHQQILDLAEELIRTRGYHAFSYKDIALALKVKNAAIHYHFPSKADLGVAVIRRNRTFFREASQRWANLSPEKQLKRFVNIYQQSKAEDKVCIMGALGPVSLALPEKMQEELKQASFELKKYLVAVLKKGRQTGVFAFPESVEEKATLIVGSLLAGLILDRVMGIQNLERVVRGIQKSL